MTTAALIAELRGRGIRVWADGDRLQCDAPVGALTPELRDRLRACKSEIMRFLREPAGLSCSQRRLWFLEQLDPGGPSYVIAQALELRGALDAALLERALAAMVDRHESLRTTFVDRDGHLLQIVSEAPTWRLPVAEVDNEAEVRERLRREAARGFDLAIGPLFRANLYRLAADRHVLLLTMHHIVADAWSMRVLTRELGETCQRLSRGEVPALPTPVLQYRDIARWQQDRSHVDTLQPMLARWRARLAGAPRMLELRADRPRPAGPRRRGATWSFALTPELGERLRGLARSEGSTLFPVLVAAFAVLLARYSGQEDLLVGTPVANRTRPEVEGIVGCFINTIVLRAGLADDPTARGFVARMREVCWDALADQELPFERLVEDLRPERDLARNPLFQVMFAWEGGPPELLELPGLDVRPVDVHRDVAQFDLMLQVAQTHDGLAGTFYYAADLFEEATIARMAAHWRSLLEGFVDAPDRRVSQLPMLSAAEQRQLLVEWNQTAAGYPRDACVHDLFAAQVARTPDAIAVRAGDQQLTYRELEHRADQLARRLCRLGVGPEVLVGLCVDRSVEMVVGILGVLIAGGAYVPIDPAYPAERLAFLIDDARTPVLLTQVRLLSRLPGHRATTVCLDADAQALTRLPAPDRRASATNLAYVIYTSGSTGRPKGVCITHRGLVNYLWWASSAYEVAAGTGAPVHSSIAFDLTVTSLFTPLLAGRTVELLPDDRGAEALAGAVRRAAGYSLVKLTPAHLQLLQLQVPPGEVARRTRTMVIGGEQLAAETVAFWREHAPETALVNEYGPTETVVGCCTYRVSPATRSTGAVPIGRPIANTRLYVLDRHMQPVPIGVAGELYIGGDGVARGYLNRPELTRQRFVPDVFDPDSPTALYRTGDFVRYLPDGNLEFLGRSDDQVKVRGFRVELGEIESALRRSIAVREAAVALRDDVRGEPRLVAYVVFHAGHTATPGDLRGALEQQLPAHMLPSAWVMLDELPLTQHGKVDRGALPVPPAVGRSEAAYLPPRTGWETRLARVWQDVLHVALVGVGDDFFDLGGHSLLVVKLVAEINRRLGVGLSVADVFANPTVGQMAEWIGGNEVSRRRRSAVVQLRSGSDEMPVYFIYAGPDEFGLASLMSDRRAVYGVDVPWPLAWRRALAARRRSGLPTLEQLVTLYVTALRAHVRDRPCVLAGHSFAGVIAFEAAHRLLKLGANVEMVLLLDTWARPPGPLRVAWHRWLRDLDALGRTPADGRSRSIGARIRILWRTTRWLLAQERDRVRRLLGRSRPDHEVLTSLLDEEGLPLPESFVQRAYVSMVHSYHPRRLDSRGVLLRTEPGGVHAVLRGFDESQGWSKLFAQGLEIIPMIGDHLSMIRQHNPRLAREVDEVLTRHWLRTRGNGQAARRSRHA